jgi:hypothetical protein
MWRLMLKSWLARRYEDGSREGRTRPLFLRCALVTDSNDGSSSDSETFVVKGIGLPEITPQCLFNEAVGNLIARRLGLEVPEVALILITEEFVKAIEPQLSARGVRLEPGIGVGTRFIRGLANVVPGYAPSGEELEQMALLYGFDLLVQNPDRRLDNPNCAVLDGKLVPFDFEMCFSFLMALGSHEPWELSAHGIGKSHLFHATLRSRSSLVEWRPLLTELCSMTNEEITKIVSAVPVAWQGNAERIKKHLIILRDESDRLELELQRSLS